jgi:hypothetical protein
MLLPTLFSDGRIVAISDLALVGSYETRLLASAPVKNIGREHRPDTATDITGQRRRPPGGLLPVASTRT